MEIGKPEDASFHLQESEKALLKVQQDDMRGITSLLLMATASRNRDLYRKAQAKIEEKQLKVFLPKAGSEQAMKE